MNWTEVIIKTTTPGSDIIAEVFYEAGMSGTVIEDRSDIAIYQKPEGIWDYIDEDILDDMDPDVLVKGYLPDDEKLHDRIQYIQDRIRYLKSIELDEIDLGKCSIAFNQVKDEDWATSWKKYYKPIKIGKLIVIKPTWETYTKKEDEVIIELDPGMAFGTGTHETTMMCIQLIEKYLKTGDKVIDVGCGSGVLSLVAAKLGAETCLAVDFDTFAVKITRENVILNKLEDKVIAKESNLLDHITVHADIIIANIIADVIMKLSNSVYEHLKNDGIFIASGIIKDRTTDVENVLYKDGFQVIEMLSMGEWVAFAFRKAR